MKLEKMLTYVDHTLLAPTSTWKQIDEICKEACFYHTASVCIPPSFVKEVDEKYGDKLVVCTVIGFPLGYHTTKTKVYEAKCAIEDGAKEIDMVVNMGWIKEGKFELVLEEIKAIRVACKDVILKVIIETCYLTEDEKIKLCEIVTNAGADFIKTSTGFGTAGATLEDITLFKKYIGVEVKIKAAGGVSNTEDLEAFIAAGSDRIGTSRAVGFAKNMQGEGY